MKRILIFLPVLAIWTDARSQLAFSGNLLPVISETVSADSGLDALYVLSDTHGVNATYTAVSGGPNVKWYRFSNLGGAYSEEVTQLIREGNSVTLPDIAGNMGYIIEDGSSRLYFWVVDYSSFPLSLRSLDISPESDCSTVTLDFAGDAAPIHYYTINGRMQELSRGLTLEYSTLEYSSDSDTYGFVDKKEEVDHVVGQLRVTAPFCNTDFTLSGDRFMAAWGDPEQVVSGYYEAIAVEAHTSAEQVRRENDNEQSSGDAAGLGGSAPAEIDFHAVTTDAAIFREWQIATDAEFNFIEYRDSDFDMNYVFRSDGTFYVRFMASNAAGSCDYYSQSYEVSIGESDIKCPNAFSPGSSEGVNDIWKVSYKSIIDFECHIFNRWGVQVCHFDDPSQGWDGKYKGKLVPSGVYYYVIKARGADGRDYNLKGDINIIGYKLRNDSTGNISE